MRRRSALGLIAAATLTVTAVAWPWHASAATPAPATPPAADAAPAAEPAVLTGEPTIEPVEAIVTDENTPMIQLRDGSELPALNDVPDTTGLKWAGSRSATPVTGVLRGRAYDVYVHEDGSHTSTIPVKNLMTGEVGTSSYVAHPIEIDPAKAIIADPSRAQPVPGQPTRR